MAKNHCSVAHAIVEVSFMIGRSELATPCRGGKEWIRLVKAHGTVDPTGQKLLGSAKELFRFDQLCRDRSRAIIIVMLITLTLF